MFDEHAVFLRVNPRDVNFVNQIMEGYEHLGVVTTLNRPEGILAVRATPDTASDVRAIMAGLPVKVELIDRPEELLK